MELTLNLILNLILISKLNYTGAAVAKLASEALHFVLMAYLVSKYFALISFHRELMKAAVSCIAMYMFIRFLGDWSLLVVIPSAAVVYALSLGILGGYTREEFEFGKRSLRGFVSKLKVLRNFAARKHKEANPHE